MEVGTETGEKDRCRSSQDGAAAPFTGLAGPVRERLRGGDATAVAPGVIGRGRLGGAGVRGV